MKRLVLCFVCCVTHASDLCVMLSPAEEAALIRAEDQARRRGGQTKNPRALRLGGIIYTDPKSWTIWLNGRSIKAGESIATIRILNVMPEFVELIWSPKPDEHHRICLKPNDEIFQDGNAFP